MRANGIDDGGRDELPSMAAFYGAGRRLGVFLEGLLGDDAHDGCLGDHHAVYRHDALRLHGSRFLLENLHLNPQRIPRQDGLAELSFFNGGKEHKLRRAIGNAHQDENSRHLRHGFDDQHARHDRKIREVTSEEWLVGCYVLDADNAVRLHLHDPVHEKERIAVREDVANFDVFQDCHGERVILTGIWRCLRVMDPILEWMECRREELIALLRAMVECESPSDDAASVNRFQELLVARSAGLARPKFTKSAGAYGRNLLLDFALPGPRRKTPGRILGVGHADTVWSLGKLRSMPFRREQGRLWGPGVLDMKAGLAFFLYATKALRELDLPVARKVSLWVVSDEEVGSAGSRAQTEALARQACAVLVLEPGTGLEGKLKTARKGVGMYTVGGARHGPRTRAWTSERAPARSSRLAKQLGVAWPSFSDDEEGHSR
jgi:hypothetical protein